MEIKRKNVLEDRHLDLKTRRGNNVELGLRKCVMVGSLFNLWLVSVAVSLIVNTVTECQSWKMVYLHSFFTFLMVLFVLKIYVNVCRALSFVA
jgi:uncharacterized protein involved in cysteine biosynthesis